MKFTQRELEQQQWKIEYQNDVLKVFIADVIPLNCCQRENMEDRMLEMENLVQTFGGVVILRHIQKRGVPDYETYIGWGKLDEIISEMKDVGANLLIFWNILKPYQIYNVNERLRAIGAKSWDRVDLILKIFERHAKTTEAKLQIELAAIHHMWPRIFGMWLELSSQWRWGWQSKGKWETNTEIMKRHLRQREISIREELEKCKKVRNEHRKARKRKWFITIGIVGYTNAGKSSLLNLLTKKWVLSQDKLFATLWTSVWKMHISYADIPEMTKKRLWLSEYQEMDILLSDTIGFIRDLPPDLIDAFSSTLEDSIESDILLHVVDASDPKIDEKIEVVDTILSQIWAHQKKIYVFNKIDMIDQERIESLEFRFQDREKVCISTYEKRGLQELIQCILKTL